MGTGKTDTDENRIALEHLIELREALEDTGDDSETWQLLLWALEQVIRGARQPGEIANLVAYLKTWLAGLVGS